ncbi:uncharacterized protein LY89DRAFT_600105 [Mollisia scopiformis]|uniref:Amino acid permease/ SLC12A domain-containing protein n=1 Tax=Mollisia scopiformis TaxID=149040 RepID=A0A132B873_MOLSC|nr:uncharacterized protein LY89DRAFT_600105 [Mollisia scopiformis]KUJ08189.1 hypothetical protein LY89DRAFT_600105 [Mollisia scopiformis]
MVSQNSSVNDDLDKRSRFRRFVDSFDRHPRSFEPDAELTLALDKSLKAYHSQLIALGGAIGTGLFVGSGEGLGNAGPWSLLGAFAFVGFTLCPTVFALAEMATLFPVPGGFFEHCRMYTDEAWGGAMGWSYVIQWLLTLPLELVAASITLQYWNNPLPHAAWVTIFLFGIVIINVFGVKGFANVEATLSIVKVVAIVGFIVFGIFRDIGLGFDGRPMLGVDKQPIVGVRTWYHPGASTNGWYGFCSVVVTAAFAYSGSEMVGLTAAEQENPRRDLPKAIKKVFWRIGLFYIASIFVVGLLVGYDDPHLLRDNNFNSAASPFVIAIKNAGVPILPAIFNSVILVTVLSVANSSAYGSSRVLNAMANAGLAPKTFAYIDTQGRPLHCFYLAFTVGLLSYLSELTDESVVFNWLLSTVGLSVIFSWTTICVTHLRFRQALKLHNKDLDTLPYRSPLGIIGSWTGLICNLLIIILQFVTAVHPIEPTVPYTPSQRAQQFFLSFMSFPLVLMTYIGFKFFKGTEIHGISFSRRTILTFNNVWVEWGEGTKVVNLRTDVDFREAWNLGDYIKYAKAHPDLVVKDDPLWFVPPKLKPFVKSFAFPWY